MNIGGLRPFKIGDRVKVHRDGVFQYIGTITATRFDRGDLYRIREDNHGTFCDSYGFELELFYPEYCPQSRSSLHSESWYDCEPCDFCGDDTPPESCDCGKPGHAAVTK